jgi:hypothetical protein
MLVVQSMRDTVGKRLAGELTLDAIDHVQHVAAGLCEDVPLRLGQCSQIRWRRDDRRRARGVSRSNRRRSSAAFAVFATRPASIMALVICAAHLAGFTDAPHLTRTFRRMLDATPRSSSIS